MPTLALDFLLAASSSSSHQFANAEPQCTVHDADNNRYFDLRPLIKTTGENYKAKGFDSGLNFDINVCHTLVTGDEEFKQYGASWSGGGESGALGRPSTKPFVRGDSLLLEYHEGSPCPDNPGSKQSAVISFICDKNVQGNGAPAYVANADRCSYWFEWRTQVACPQSQAPKDGDPKHDNPSDGNNNDNPAKDKDGKNNDGGSKDSSTGFFGVLFIITFIVGTIYFMAGILYNRIFHQSRGLEQIPHHRFWVSVFGFIKDMILILWYPFAEWCSGLLEKIGIRRRNSGFNYSSIADRQADINTEGGSSGQGRYHQGVSVNESDFDEEDDDDQSHPGALRYNHHDMN
ncbi:Cation-independent mannose-6-phosphate receptor CI-MPR [Mycoemilia scoparia]|uniref:Autophagy-related protein 27 n=1 Tax=Mycoemilia scoparia TaxID=417184 RepID=A0A9W7ZX76_9FUNG|nr:Cation-independent mannose-6-phosphate receptor CI-MPR [Mycoemilia scoparia]